MSSIPPSMQGPQKENNEVVATKGMVFRFLAVIAFRILSWPFIAVGGIGLVSTLYLLLSSSPNPSSFLEQSGLSLGQWFLYELLAGALLSIGLLFRWASGKIVINQEQRK
jgi:hypothetical protein